MKNKLKGKFLLSIATLSLALVSSVGSTFAWFLISEKADLTGLDIQVTTGSSVLLKDEDKSTSEQEIYSKTFDIKNSNDAKWDLIKPKTVTGATTDGAESGKAATMTISDTTKLYEAFEKVNISNTVSTKKWAYDALPNNITAFSNTHVYGTTSATPGTTDNIAYFYKIDFKYRVSAGYDVNIAITKDSVKVTNEKEEKLTTGEDTQTIDKVIRVAFQDNKAKTASVYRIAKTTETDYNKQQINSLIEGATLDGDQYNCTLLSDKNKHKVSEPTDATYSKDNAFYYGTTSMYVWYDGTDKACSNAVFKQTCTFGVTFTAVEQATTTTGA